MALEESSFCMRLCCGPIRSWTINVTKDGNPFSEHIRPIRCMPAGLKCCCYQEMTTTAGGEVIGSFKEKFFCFVPSYAIKGPTGEDEFNIHMPTCCGGVCVDPCAEGCCNCKIPFYLYKPDKDEPGQHVGKIIKVWGGLAKELFADADTFMVEYPEGITNEAKANLLGATFMINQLYFESQKQGAEVG